MNDVLIIALRYDEPEWRQTFNCLVKCGVPIVIADRGGVGNMAKAYNEAFDKAMNSDWAEKKFKYVWFVSNIVFDPKILPVMVNRMNSGEYAALHPTFASDHKHIQPLKEGNEFFHGVKEVSFVEFTAPLVRTDVFAHNFLDEDMPYVGHDLDWGFRVRSEGHKIGVYHGCHVEHVYIRNNPNGHEVTKIRKALRKSWEKPTTEKLIGKYGQDWREVLGYYGNI